MDTRRTAATAAALVVALAATAGAVAWRRRGGRSRLEPQTEWTCACGQQFRVSGTGRHRVYWLAEASAADPVVGERCPACDRAFPRA
jgi:hypothetical protein